MPHHRARGHRKEAETPGPQGGQGQRQVRVAAAVRVVVDADAVEAGVLAPRDEVGDVGQGASDRHADVNLHRSILPPIFARMARAAPVRARADFRQLCQEITQKKK